MKLPFKNLERAIKQKIYGKPQKIFVHFPAGLGETALLEINSILSTPWFPQKQELKIQLQKDFMMIDHIHMITIMELLLRSQSIFDIRLNIYEGKISGTYSFEEKCKSILWELYLTKHFNLKIKVDSIASHAFHEGILKKIISSILTDQGINVVSGETSTYTTTLYVNIYKNKLSLALSLAGMPLYKRGFRTTLSQSAPLREDIAFCALLKALQFVRVFKPNFFPEKMIIPFSGTGTFAFEFFQYYYHLFPGIFNREMAIQKMSFFRKDTFSYLLKKGIEEAGLQKNLNTITAHCIDNSLEANLTLGKNIELFTQQLNIHDLSIPESIIQITTANFLDLNIEQLFEKDVMNLLIPLNPPYGIRLQTNTVSLYKKIALKINQFEKIVQTKNKNILGFILCPDESSWSIFLKTLKSAKTETYHFTQGGLDIRVCQFLI